MLRHWPSLEEYMCREEFTCLDEDSGCVLL